MLKVAYRLWKKEGIKPSSFCPGVDRCTILKPSSAISVEDNKGTLRTWASLRRYIIPLFRGDKKG